MRIGVWLSVWLGGTGLCSGQTGKEPQCPDGARDTSCLSRHHYLLKQVTVTSWMTFSRESHAELIGALQLSRGMELAQVWPQNQHSHGCLPVGPATTKGWHLAGLMLVATQKAGWAGLWLCDRWADTVLHVFAWFRDDQGWEQKGPPGAGTNLWH